jgi:replicative DNA helicase
MPTLTSLKESGNIEEDANTVLLVYRESLQNEESSFSGNDESRIELVTIKALKSRDGEANAKVDLRFRLDTGVIDDDPTTRRDLRDRKSKGLI